MCVTAYTVVLATKHVCDSMHCSLSHQAFVWQHYFHPNLDDQCHPILEDINNCYFHPNLDDQCHLILGWSLFYGTDRNGTEQFRHIIPRNGTIDACTLRSNHWPHTDLDSCWVLPGEESVYKQYSNVTIKNYSCFPANQVSSDSW